MKKQKILLASALCAVILAGCNITITTPSQSEEISETANPQNNSLSSSSAVAPSEVESSGQEMLSATHGEGIAGFEQKETNSRSPENSAGENSIPDLELIKQFLEDSQLLSFLDLDSKLSLSEIISNPENAPFQLRMILSQILLSHAEKGDDRILLNEEDIPYFPVKDFSNAGAELFGIQYDFSEYASNCTDQAPGGMMCVGWGYDHTDSYITIDPSSLRSNDGIYTVMVEQHTPFFDSEGEAVQIRRLDFRCNSEYVFCPIQLISEEIMEQNIAE